MAIIDLLLNIVALMLVSRIWAAYSQNYVEPESALDGGPTGTLPPPVPRNLGEYETVKDSKKQDKEVLFCSECGFFINEEDFTESELFCPTCSLTSREG